MIQYFYTAWYPLDPTDVIHTILIKGIAEEHTKSVIPLPKSQLDPLDLTGKIAPCCDPSTECKCKSNKFTMGTNEEHMNIESM